MQPLLSIDRFAQQKLEARLSLVLDQQKLFRAIDADPALVGAGVVFIDANGVSITLREFQPICFVKPVRVILREPPVARPVIEYLADVKTGPRETRLALEAAGAVASCGAAVIGWIVVISAGAAIPFTGGGTAFLAGLGVAAATASTLQCANSAARTYNEANEPSRNDQLDSEEWYQLATLALDLISLGGATAAGISTFKGVKLLVSQGIKPRDALGGLGRAQRKRLTEEVIRIRHPNISSKMLKFRQRSGALPKRFPNEAIRHTTITQVKDAFGASLSFGGSAIGGALRHVALAVVSEE